MFEGPTEATVTVELPGSGDVSVELDFCDGLVRASAGLIAGCWVSVGGSCCAFQVCCDMQVVDQW